MKKLKFLLFLYLLSLGTSTKLFAQKEGNIWYFGNYGGIDFNSGSPVILTNSAMSTREGVTTLSDTYGKLQFYSDGSTLYNAKHTAMPNGYGLQGNPSASQSVIGVPWPGHPGKYYLFTTFVNNGVKYSIIDMTLDNGYGDIITGQKNLDLLSYNLSTEKIMVTKHCNNTDFWVITPANGTNNFYVYLLSASGLSAPTIYSVGTPINGNTGTWGSIGYIKVSPDGKLLTHIRGNELDGTPSSFAEVFPFNNLTGAIGNSIAKLQMYNMGYGIEYSPNSKLLYVSTNNAPNRILQYDLTATNINSSMVELYSTSSYNFGALQLAPDGKIYVAAEQGFNNSSPALSTIDFPNQPGMACHFSLNSLNIFPGRSLLGLPTVMTNYVYDAHAIKATDTCVNKSTVFTLNSTNDVTSINWDFGDGTTGTGLTATHKYTQAGIYTVNAAYTGPCSSGTAKLTIHINGPVTTTVNVNICNGHTYTLPDGRSISAAGTYTSIIQRLDGCGNDSTILTTVTLNASYQLSNNVEICPGSSYKLPDGIVATTSGDYVSKLTSQFGCDSIITTHLKVLPVYNLTEKVNICPNQIYRLPDGRVVSQTGTYVSNLKTVNTACDSVITTTIVLGSGVTTEETIHVCNGATYTLPDGRVVSTAGDYTSVAKTPGGCAPTVITHLIVNQPYTVTVDTMICKGATVVLPDGVNVTAEGTYTSTLHSIYLCDSIITTKVTYLPNYDLHQVAYICQNNNYTLPDGRIVNTAGTYVSNLKTYHYNCDSIITTVLNVMLPTNTTTTVPLCKNATYQLPDGPIVSQPGTYISRLTRILGGCDSIINTIVVWQENYYAITVTDTCENATTSFSLDKTSPATSIIWDFGDGTTGVGTTAVHNYGKAGNYTVTASLTGICSPTLQLSRVVHIMPQYTINQTIHLCNGYTYTLPDGIVVGTAGVYTSQLKSIAGCDSTFTTTIIVNQPYYINVDTAICRGTPLTLPDGRIVTAAGTYTSTLQSVYTCDSIITTNLSYHPDYAIAENVKICPNSSYKLPDGRIINTAGTYTSNLKTYQFGCDSIITTTVDLYITTSSANAEICQGSGYTLPDNRMVYTSGVYTSILKSYAGCDSTITTNLIVHPAYSFTINAELCENATYTLVDGTVVNKAGQYTSRYQTIYGCDSIYYTILVPVALPHISLGTDSCLITNRPLVLTPGPGFASYKWSTGETTAYCTVSSEGVYAVRVSNGCGSAAAQIQIIACSEEIFVPNAFTPNGDGKNDVFRIINYHGQQLIRFSIFNRWGNEIFITNNPLRGWDGSINGVMQDIGAYVYIIQYKNLEGKEKILKGTVTLIR